MRRRAAFGLVALLPAALNLSAPAAAGPLMMPLCSGDGQVRMVEVPGAPKSPAGSDNGCCAKGCHSSSSRKRLQKKIEPAQ